MYKKILLFMFYLITPFLIINGVAQPPPPPPVDIPIDGGLLFLLVSGLVYGGKKFYSNVREKTESEK
ncbi:MAG: hypothetical protein U9Q83_09360 [Bacteroidota bacterium]|nr:hypothetical protein [Bacteroidota bacterium]